MKKKDALGAFVDGGFSLRQIAVKMEKSAERVRQKMFKLGLKEQQQKKHLF